MTLRRGNQEPRVRYEPERAYSDMEDAAELSSAYGMVPDPWQRLVLDAWLGRDENDMFTSTTCGLSVPRQNGKNALLEMREFYGLVAIGEKILHSAHEVKTANEAFRRLASFFENDAYPELQELVLRIRRTNGQEAIELINGGVIKFSARSKGAARGMSFDCVVFDEAQFMRDEELEAMMSTMAAAPLGNRQVLYTGTPPTNDTQGEVFGRVRRSAFEKTDKRLSWHEWSVENIGDIFDKERWYATNPALGFRLDETFTEAECHSLSEEGFARERLGWWESFIGRAVIDQESWDELATEDPPADGKLAYGVKFSPDGSSVALAVALKPKNGKPYVELIEHRSMRDGINWLSTWLVERKSKAAVIVIDGKSGADTLLAQLREAKVPAKAMILAGTKGIVASTSRFQNAVKEKEIEHYAQPALDAAVLHAKKRPIGKDGGCGFGGIADFDVSPLEAVALAYWGVMTTKRNPGRKAKVL